VPQFPRNPAPGASGWPHPGQNAAPAAGAGAGAALILVQFGARAPNIRFDSDAGIVLGVSPRRENKK
jgi:hypothetical protein